MAQYRPMSEYQYYEFQAIDSPLTRQQVDEVGKWSTRARITPTSFTNEYHFGSFRGDPLEFVRRYFDLHVYFANWGTRRWLFAVPRSTIDVECVEAYAVGDILDMRPSGKRYLIDISLSPDDGGDDFDLGQDTSTWSADLAQLRRDVMDGDFRLLYMAWLLGLQCGQVDEAESEPPVPPGLKQLSGPLQSFQNVFALDEDLLAAAAQNSGELAKPDDTGLTAWIAHLPGGQKDQMLVDLCTGSRPALGGELLATFRKSQAKPPAHTAPLRSVTQLQKQADACRVQREVSEAAEVNLQRQRQQRERDTQLRRIASDSEQHWSEVQTLVQSKQSSNYGRAVEILADLHDAAALVGRSDEFEVRL